jgi:hypothetical protein
MLKDIAPTADIAIYPGYNCPLMLTTAVKAIAATGRYGAANEVVIVIAPALVATTPGARDLHEICTMLLSSRVLNTI